MLEHGVSECWPFGGLDGRLFPFHCIKNRNSASSSSFDALAHRVVLNS